MLKEFRDFIMTGNVIDLAVAVILAAAVGLVINGFVNDIMMPVVGHFTGGKDFSDLRIVLTHAQIDLDGNIIVAENAIRYGAWINTLINLIIVGLILFLIVKVYNRFRKPLVVEVAEPAGPPKPTQEELLAEIRDLLKNK
jgi:large conductance mechanosensitive channel